MQKNIQSKDTNNDILSKMDRFFEKHEKLFLWISMSLGIISSILMFDCKVSLSGDDCDYVINAERFFKHFTYPIGRGALYPIVISPFMIGGLHLILLKVLSAVFIMLSMWFLYKSFRGKIPASILMPTLLIVNICPYIFFYACQTYSEPFFMFIQSLFFYFFSKYFLNKESQKPYEIKTDWSKFLIISFCFLAMGLTRTIGYAVMGALILYFCFQKQWKYLIYTFASCIIVFCLFALFKSIIWPDSGAAYSITNYLAINYYNPEQGLETIPGYINRIVVNSQIYLSGFMYKFMGFRSASDLPLERKPILTIFTYIIFFICLIAVFKRNKHLLFTGLYVGVMNFASFILLQILWEQDRLILIYYPYILIFLLGGIYYILKKNTLNGFAFIYPIIIAVIFLCTGFHLKERASRNIPVLQQNLLGNDLYGLTPDWENFIKMSRWANDNLDKKAIIISRKPSISYIYTGREFTGIFSVPNVSLEEIKDKYQKEKDQFIFIAMDFAKSYSGFSPFTQYLFITKGEAKFSINNKPITAAIIYKIDKSAYNDELIAFLNENQVLYTSDFETFLKQYINDKNIGYQIFSPDELLESIKNMNAKYLLLPRIRMYTPENTGRYVNTIHQYISFIQIKYPNSFKIIKSIGGNTEQEKQMNEACELAEFIGQ